MSEPASFPPVEPGAPRPWRWAAVQLFLVAVAVCAGPQLPGVMGSQGAGGYLWLAGLVFVVLVQTQIFSLHVYGVVSADARARDLVEELIPPPGSDGAAVDPAAVGLVDEAGELAAEEARAGASALIVTGVGFSALALLTWGAQQGGAADGLSAGRLLEAVPRAFLATGYGAFSSLNLSSYGGAVFSAYRGLVARRVASRLGRTARADAKREADLQAVMEELRGLLGRPPTAPVVNLELDRLVPQFAGLSEATDALRSAAASFAAAAAKPAAPAAAPSGPLQALEAELRRAGEHRAELLGHVVALRTSVGTLAAGESVSDQLRPALTEFVGIAPALRSSAERVATEAARVAALLDEETGGLLERQAEVILAATRSMTKEVMGSFVQEIKAPLATGVSDLVKQMAQELEAQNQAAHEVNLRRLRELHDRAVTQLQQSGESVTTASDRIGALNAALASLAAAVEDGSRRVGEGLPAYETAVAGLGRSASDMLEALARGQAAAGEPAGLVKSMTRLCDELQRVAVELADASRRLQEAAAAAEAREARVSQARRDLAGLLTGPPRPAAAPKPGP